MAKSCKSGEKCLIVGKSGEKWRKVRKNWGIVAKSGEKWRKMVNTGEKSEEVKKSGEKL